jgi:hypothetical protein
MSVCRAAFGPASRSVPGLPLGRLPAALGRADARAAPDVSISSEIGFEDDLMRRIVEGTLDLALMYTPQHSAGLQVEHLFDETLILVTSDPEAHRAGRRLCLRELGADLLCPAQQGLPESGAAGPDGEHRLARSAVDPGQRRDLLRPGARRRALRACGMPARRTRKPTGFCCRPMWSIRWRASRPCSRRPCRPCTPSSRNDRPPTAARRRNARPSRSPLVTDYLAEPFAPPGRLTSGGNRDRSGALAERVRSACLQAASTAYEQAGISGLCGEGRWELAVQAIETLDLAPLLETPTVHSRNGGTIHAAHRRPCDACRASITAAW